LAPKKRGRAAAAVSPLARRVAELERDKARVERRLKQAEAIIDAQKKLAEILGLSLPATDDAASTG
jgi:L-fucose isomerase-like protein